MEEVLEADANGKWTDEQVATLHRWLQEANQAGDAGVPLSLDMGQNQPYAEVTLYRVYQDREHPDETSLQVTGLALSPSEKSYLRLRYIRRITRGSQPSSAEGGLEEQAVIDGLVKAFGRPLCEDDTESIWQAMAAAEQAHGHKVVREALATLADRHRLDQFPKHLPHYADYASIVRRALLLNGTGVPIAGVLQLDPTAPWGPVPEAVLIRMYRAMGATLFHILQTLSEGSSIGDLSDPRIQDFQARWPAEVDALDNRIHQELYGPAAEGGLEEVQTFAQWVQGLEDRVGESGMAGVHRQAEALLRDIGKTSDGVRVLDVATLSPRGPATVVIYIDPTDAYRPVWSLVQGTLLSRWNQERFSGRDIRFAEAAYDRDDSSRAQQPLSVGIRRARDGAYRDLPTIQYQSLRRLRQVTGAQVLAAAQHKVLDGEIIVGMVSYETVTQEQRTAFLLSKQV